jgi:PiT family inorganic phosphate transporter
VESALTVVFVLIALLAFANGANDVSKGIATLVGSGVTNYRKAILWGTGWTVLGGLMALFFSAAMVKTFSSGLLSYEGGTDGLPPALGFAVMTGAIAWVLFATRAGLPVSTTHAITGALGGAGLAALGWHGLQGSVFLQKIVLPLLISPPLALALAFLLTPAIRRTMEGWMGHCICVFPAQPALLSIEQGGVVNMVQTPSHIVTAVDTPECDTAPRILTMRMGPNTLHWFTSGLTSMARGLNDAPKIAALLVGYSLLTGDMSSTGMQTAFIVVALSMGAGSLLSGFRITEVLAEKVTRMDHLEGLAANLTTALMVIAGARLGLPMSTTHVSSGAIIGMGLRRGADQIHWKKVIEMILAWVVTVPVAALLAAGSYYLFHAGL